jgi:2-haloacid dehalogenase
MKITLAFDVYGTLVDPSCMAKHLADEVGTKAGELSPFWLVSSNPWDIIGARSAGLSSAWVQRSEEKIYDPWGIEPNVIVRSLVDLPAALEDEATSSENPVE